MTKGFDHVFRMTAAKEAVLEAARAYIHTRDEKRFNDLELAVSDLQQLEAEFAQDEYFLRWDVAENKEREEP